MNRKKWIFLNLVIVLAALGLFGWNSLLYLSPQTCVEDSLKQLYFAPAEKLGEVRYKTMIFYLYANPDRSQIALHGAKETFGFFYTTAGGATHIPVETTESFALEPLQQEDLLILAIHRTDSRIEKIQAELDNGQSLTATDWHDNFALTALVVPDSNYSSWSGVYRAYDQEGELISEIQY